MIRIFLTGAHANRTPFSYPALTPLWSGFAKKVTRPQEADLYLFAHIQDVKDAPRDMVRDWRRRRRPVVILSEEPFWDSIWGRQPLTRQRAVDTEFGTLPVIQLNHHTSSIFDFERIPYYLLSDHRFANAYAARFMRNAALSPQDWQARFAALTQADTPQLTFMFERRPEAFHNMIWRDGDIIGLCAWRTELAQECARILPGHRVDLLGQSWQGGPTRFELGNWHRNKLARLDGKTPVMAGFENTHQPNYISEKLFDAFACGAWPLYYASPRHRIHGLGLPAPAWGNLFGRSPPEAAAQVANWIETWPRDLENLIAYARAQGVLARLFGTPANWTAERARLARALKSELEQVLESEPVA